MPKRASPKVSIIHHRVEPPKYTADELEGIKDLSLRLKKHIEILEEEIKSKRAQLIGLEKIISSLP